MLSLKNNQVRIVIIISTLLCIQSISAQQEKMNTQYIFNKLALNPAYTGASENLSVVAVYRNQWSGIQGQPIEYFLSGAAPIGKSNHNIGFNVNLDKIGPISNFNFYGNYAYKLKLDDSKSLRLGLRGGVDHGVINQTALDAFHAGDPTYTTPNAYYTKPVLGTGVYFESKKLALGASIPNVFISSIDVGADSTIYRNSLQLFAGGEYLIDLGTTWKLKPATYIRFAANSPIVVDGNAYLIYNSILWLGGGYRTTNTFMGNILLVFNENLMPKLKNEMKIGYSYDFSNNNYNQVTNGAHEITFTLNFNKSSTFNNGIQTLSPRYF